VDIAGFGDAFVQRIAATTLGSQFTDEKAFERGHLVESAWELSRANPEIRVFTHPWGRDAECKSTCEAAAMDFVNRVEGCPICWKRSKKRSVADVFGMRNNFDLAAVDRDNGSLVVEVKWLLLKANKGPNGEFQRFIGQCTLAASANNVVIGVCGLWGRRDRALDAHDDYLKEKLGKIGVRLIVLRTQS
jgi:hypothetical protein